MIAILASTVKTFKFQDNWINYRTTHEILKGEIYLYKGNIDDYAKTNDKEALFIKRVENMISRENVLWRSSYKFQLDLTKN